MGLTTSGTERFTTGGPLIGEPVDLGPNSGVTGILIRDIASIVATFASSAVSSRSGRIR